MDGDGNEDMDRNSQLVLQVCVEVWVTFLYEGGGRAGGTFHGFQPWKVHLGTGGNHLGS